MNKFKLITINSILISLAMVIPANLQAYARGGRGGGGMPGGGGGFRPNPGRPAGSPAARPTPAPRPAPGPRPGTTPVRPGNGGAGNPGGNGPGGFNRPIGGNPGGGTFHPNPGGPVTRPGGRPNAGDIAGSIGAHPPGHMPGNPGYRPGYPGYHKPEMTTNINNHFRYSPVYGGYPFSHAWCGHVNWHYHAWPYWAGVATGAAITSWIGGAPYAGYGSSTTLVYYPVEAAPQGVYDQSVATPAQVVQNGQQTTIPDDEQWLNIGAFGIIPIHQTDMTFALQLASASDGSVRGMQWDFKDNTVFEVEGSIEKDTLRVAWQKKGAPNSPYFESTVDQLTQKESFINVYDPQTKSLVSWQMIQIEESDLPPQN